MSPYYRLFCSECGILTDRRNGEICYNPRVKQRVFVCFNCLSVADAMGEEICVELPKDAGENPGSGSTV